MKKGKLNNKGFVLVETLIVSVFIAAIFAILYNNFYPLMGEYEKREVYDDIDGKYATYWIKRIIQHSQTNIGDDCKLDKLKTAPYHCKFSCDMAGNDSMKAMCKQLIEKSQIYVKDGEPSIYITTYNLAQFKEYVNENGGVSGGMHRYVKYLPIYKVDSLNNAKHRVIVEFHRTRDDNDYLAYSTFEVKKQ